MGQHSGSITKLRQTTRAALLSTRTIENFEHLIGCPEVTSSMYIQNVLDSDREGSNHALAHATTILFYPLADDEERSIVTRRLMSIHSVLIRVARTETLHEAAITARMLTLVITEIMTTGVEDIGSYLMSTLLARIQDDLQLKFNNLDINYAQFSSLQ